MNLVDVTQRIRGDKDLGKGSCSHLDECFTDTELTQLINETIDEIRVTGHRPIYKTIREVLYDQEVLWWEVEGITWPTKETETVS